MRSHRTCAAFVLLSLVAATASAGECTSTILTNTRGRPGDLIELRAKGKLPKGVLAEAVALWEECPGYGLGFPAFVTEPREVPPMPVRTLTVEYHPRSESPVCGRFFGNEIHLYAFARDDRGRVRHCGAPELLLAHELGHVLGLADAGREAACREHVMAHVDELNRGDRRVRPSECETAGLCWQTAAERESAGAAGP